MTVSQPVQRVVDCLSTAGYRERESKTAIASVPFEFSAILVGSDRALDLIVVIDTLVEPELRIRQKVEGLGRALDLVTSRRPLTVILVGPAPKATTIQALSRVCRVLSVGTPTVRKRTNILRTLWQYFFPLSCLPYPTQLWTRSVMYANASASAPTMPPSRWSKPFWRHRRRAQNRSAKLCAPNSNLDFHLRAVTGGSYEADAHRNYDY